MERMIEATVKQELKKADIQINGPRPWDIRVNDPRFYDRIIAEGSMGLGESYMDGWWDCDRIDEMVNRLLRSRLDTRYASDWHLILSWLQSKFFNLQSKSRAFIVGEHHYDTGNKLFEAMLDKRLAYSCGYWKDARNLDEAQEAKLDLICRKVDLKPGMKVLDIGCGWGSFAKFAAEKYGAEVVGITVSEQQLDYVKQACKGLSVDVHFQDYRDLNDSFDRIISIGQFEHVGPKNYAHYFEICKKCLKKDGLMLLHTIGGNTTVKTGDAWIRKYIFPNGFIPSIKQVGAAIEPYFIMEDWHNFGADYDKTLMAWLANFESHWNELKQDYDDRFYRMWTYYLQVCAGGFRARDIQLWQIVLSPKGIEGGYHSIR